MVLYRTTSAIGPSSWPQRHEPVRTRGAEITPAHRAYAARRGSRLLRNTPPRGEQRIHFLLCAEPILLLEPGHEAAPLGAQIGCLGDHAAACLRRDGARCSSRCGWCSCGRGGRRSRSSRGRCGASCGRRLGGRGRGARGGRARRRRRARGGCRLLATLRWNAAPSGHLKFLLKFKDGEPTPLSSKQCSGARERRRRQRRERMAGERIIPCRYLRKSRPREGCPSAYSTVACK